MAGRSIGKHGNEERVDLETRVEGLLSACVFAMSGRYPKTFPLPVRG